MTDHRTTVRLSHTDASGRIFYSRVFELAHEALEEFLVTADHSVARLIAEATVGLPVVHAEVDFLAPLLAGDRLAIRVTVGPVGRTSFTILYHIVKEDGTEAAHVTTVHVAIDASSGTKIDLPAPLRAALERVRPAG